MTIRDDSKPKSPFAAFLSAFSGNGQPSRPAVPIARRPLGAAPAKKRPCNCTGKRRSP